jgi:hypothetical protein
MDFVFENRLEHSSYPLMMYLVRMNKALMDNHLLQALELVTKALIKLVFSCSDFSSITVVNYIFLSISDVQCHKQ